MRLILNGLLYAAVIWTMLVVLILLGGCSLASLAWDQAIDKRVTQLEQRVSALEVQAAKGKTQ